MTEQDPPPERAVDGDFSIRKMARVVGLLAIAGLAGQLITVGRELFVADKVGVAASLDAVLVAITPPLVIAGILSSGVGAALVPAYLDTEARLGTRAARGFLGALLTWISLIGIASMVVLLVVPTVAVGIAGPGLDADARADAAVYVRIASPLLLTVALGNVLSGVCQIHGRFMPIAVARILGPLVSLGATILLWSRLGLGSVPVALVVGETCAALALVAIATRAGMIPRPRLRFSGGALGGFVRHAGPLAAGSVVLQFNLLSDRAVGTLIGAGSVSALRYGQQLVIQPLGALVSAWATVLYPAIVKRAIGGADDLAASVQRALRASIVLATPAAVWMAAAAPLVVELVYRRGAFSQSDVTITTGVVIAFAPMIALSVIQPVLTGAHNARRRAKLLAGVAVTNAVLTLILDVAFGLVLGVGGIALASSVTVFILLAFLATRISEPGFDGRLIARASVRAFVASALAVLPTLVVARLVPPGLGLALAPILGVLALSMAAIYLILSGRFGLAEPRLVLDSLRTRFAPRT